jgi:hypothetical protein
MAQRRQVAAGVDGAVVEIAITGLDERSDAQAARAGRLAAGLDARLLLEDGLGIFLTRGDLRRSGLRRRGAIGERLPDRWRSLDGRIGIGGRLVAILADRLPGLGADLGLGAGADLDDVAEDRLAPGDHLDAVTARRHLDAPGRGAALLVVDEHLGALAARVGGHHDGAGAALQLVGDLDRLALALGHRQRLELGDEVVELEDDDVIAHRQLDDDRRHPLGAGLLLADVDDSAAGLGLDGDLAGRRREGGLREPQEDRAACPYREEPDRSRYHGESITARGGPLPAECT